LYRIARQKTDHDLLLHTPNLPAKQAPANLTTNSAGHKPAELSRQAAVTPHFIAVIPLANGTIRLDLVREAVAPPHGICCAS